MKGRNKNNSFLVGVLYQPSSNENEKRDWLEHFDLLLSQIFLKWNGIIILTGDYNIDLLSERNESTQRYKEILQAYELHQHITKPTRKSKTLIDHITSNIQSSVVSKDVLFTDEISDHDTPYVIFNIKKPKFETRYKWIRNEKEFNIKSYISDFEKLPLSIIYSMDDPEDQIHLLNTLIVSCINEHAPLRRITIDE